MLITIHKKGCGSWKDCAYSAINTRKHPFQNGSYYGGICINNPVKSRKRAIKDYIEGNKFVNRVQHLIDLGLCSEFKEVTQESFSKDDPDFYYFVSEIKSNLFTFPYVEMEEEKIYYGACHQLNAIEIKKSDYVRPTSWYDYVPFGNEFNGGTEYRLKQVAKNEPSLNEGYQWSHNNPGNIDGYGVGFKGGSFIEKIY